MKNLEVKISIDENKIQQILGFLKEYYVATKIQIDIYYSTKQGRLKLRKEKIRNKENYYQLIYYERPDTNNPSERYSDYLIYPIENATLFKKVFENVLNVELKVKKTRKLYLIENARIHMDRVEDLGNFVEIEIVINNEKEMKNSKNFMENLLNTMGISELEKIDCGYRELMLQSTKKDLNYYINEQKIYWVVNEDVNENIKANSVIQCIFVEKFYNKLLMLQLDKDIKFDNFKYTAWRKFIGTIYNIRVDVLLIYNNELFTLDGELVDFNSLGKSSINIEQKFLAKFDIKK